MRSPDHRKFAAERVMLMAAPNGARRSRSDHPALPVTAGELAREAAALYEVSVSVLHLHVRDRDGSHTLAVDTYRDAIAAIRGKIGTGLVIQVTSESLGRYSPAEQMAMVRALRPEAVSLALSELCPEPGREAEAARFFQWLRSERIWPQYILYSPSELRRFDRLRRAGVFGEEHPSCMLVLGSYTGRNDGSPADLSGFLEAADCSDVSWTTCCFGPQEHRVMLAALDLGGHVRLGFENNLWLPDGDRAESNAHLFRTFLGAAGMHSRTPATAEEIREVFF